MNHIYRVVWNNITACWQVVAETARAHGKTRSTKRKLSLRPLLIGAALTLPTAAWSQTGITNFVYATTGYDSGTNRLAIVDGSTGQVYQSTTIGNALMATDPSVSPNGGLVYVPSAIDMKVRVFDATTGTLSGTAIDVPNPSWASALGRDGSKLYLGTTNFANNHGTATVIDLATRTVSASIPIGDEPEASAVSPNGSKLLIANYGTNTVSVIDTATNSASATIAVGTNPRGIIISADGSKAYVANAYDSTVSVVNLATNTVSATIALPVNAYPRGITVTPDGSKVYVAGYKSHSVYVINAATDVIAGTISIKTAGDHNDPGEFPMGVAVSPDGSKVFVASQGCAVALGCANPDSFAPGYLTAINTSDNSIAWRNSSALVAPNQVGSFVGPNLITGVHTAANNAALDNAGFGDSINFAGGTLRAGSTLSIGRAVYLHPAFNLGSGAFTSVAGGTIDTNGSDVTVSGVISGPGGLTKTGTGTLILTGANTYSGGTTVSAGTLQGNTGSLQGDVVNNAAVTFDQSSSGTYAGVMSGTGGLTKTGAGALTLTGANTMSGATTISGGTLIVNGSLASGTVTGGSGTTLGGNGTLGGNVAANGVVAPGASIGTLNIAGNATFNNGSSLRIEANDAGQADKLVVAGSATINGGTVDVRAAAGSWATTRNYTILTASGGRSGTFGSVTSDLAFLTPTLSYDANNVYLQLGRNQTAYAGIAANGNQSAVASALDRISTGTPSGDMAALLATLNGYSTQQAQGALNQLAGGTLAAAGQLGQGLTGAFSNRIQNRAHGRLRPMSDPALPRAMSGPVRMNLARAGNATEALWQFFNSPRPDIATKAFNAAPTTTSPWTGDAWGQAIIARDSQKSDPAMGLPGSKTNSYGLQLGADRMAGSATLIGGSLGWSDSTLDYDDRSGKLSTRATQVGAYLSKREGDWTFSGSVGYNWFDNETTRSVLGSQAKANYKAHAWMAGGDVAYSNAIAPGVFLTPSLGIQASWHRHGQYTESGAPGANLTVAEGGNKSLRGIAGIELAAELQGRDGKPSGEWNLNGAWQHEFADLDYPVTASFAADPSGVGFTSRGTKQTRDALRLGAGVHFRDGNRTEWFAGYSTLLKKEATSQALFAGVRVNWQ